MQRSAHLAIVGVIGVLAAGSCFVLPSLAQRASLNVVLRTFHGAVKEIDLEKSTLLLETDEGDFEFFVPPQARIFRGADSVPFTDIQKEDEATVKYYVAPSAERNGAGAPLSAADEATIKYYENEKGAKLVLSITLEG